MPSLNLRNPLRRDPSRPTLRDRAAALRASAARLIQPRPAAPIADEPGARGSTDTAARTLLAAIEREWAVFEALLGVNSEPTDDATMDAATERQAVLLKAAADLPATSREARQTKALALAWIVSTDLMARGKPRDAYDVEGRLVFDITTSMAAARSA